MKYLATLLFLVVLIPSPAFAQEGEVDWVYPTFSTGESIYTASALTGAALVELFWDEYETPAWVGPILLDDPTRNLLLPSTREGMDIAGHVSDGLLVGSLIYPFADAVLAAGYVHHDSEVVGQMMLLNLQSFGTTALVIGVSKRLIGRRRPGYARCYDEPDYNPVCNERSTKSHPSGHAGIAFTGAGLTCAHHSNLDLYGGGAADVGACVAALSVATGVALLRVAANMHYLSDVLMGGAIGFASGYLLPVLLHYSKEQPNQQRAIQQELRPPTLIQVGGAF